jgi:RepB DNA-primase from phage plasmid
MARGIDRNLWLCIGQCNWQKASRGQAMKAAIQELAPHSVTASPQKLEPDLKEAQFFLDILGPDGNFTFQTFDDRKKGQGHDPLAKVFHGSLNEHADTLIALNRQGAGIFMMVNEGDGILQDGAKSCRTGKNVVRVRAVFVDLDDAPLQPVLESGLHPNIIVTSSPAKYHAYWLVSDVGLTEFTTLQKQLIAKFKGDPSVHDLPRVLRVPGFFHQKAEPFMTNVIFPEKDKQ